MNVYPARANPVGVGEIAQAVAAIQTSTPNPDGSIVHVVQPGESLIMIANAYQISLTELLTLNNITAGFIIVPNQELLIKKAGPTPTPTPAPTNTPRPTATPWPTRTATIPPIPSLTSLPATPTATPAAPSLFQTARSRIIQDPFLVLVIGLALLGVIFFMVGNALKQS